MWLTMPGYEKVVLHDLTVPTTDIRVRMRSAVTVRVEVRAHSGDAVVVALPILLTRNPVPHA